MSFFLKLLTALVVFVAVYFFSFWMLFAQIVPETMLSLAEGAAVLTAAVLGWLTWQGMSNLALGEVKQLWITVRAFEVAIIMLPGFYLALVFDGHNMVSPLPSMERVLQPLEAALGGVPA